MLRSLQIVLLCFAGSFLPALRVSAEPLDTLQLQAEWRALLGQPADTVSAGRFAARLAAYIEQEASWRAPLPRLEGVSDITAKGGGLRLITWAHRSPASGWVHQGLIVRPRRGGGALCIALRDRQLPLEKGLIEKEWLTASGGADSWVGAVYFDAESFVYQRDTAYLLLGVAGSNAFVTRRVVETLHVSPEGTARFGLPLIAQGEHRLGRIMMSHSARVGMEINFVEGKRQVLIDHLSPSSSRYVGMPAHYGPDFSYDALTLTRGGVWVYTTNVDPADFSKSTRRKAGQNARVGNGDRRVGSYEPNWK